MYKEEIHFRNCYVNGFGRYDPGDLDRNRVPLLPRMYVWTKFEEGRSRLSQVIARKRKGYRRTEKTDRPTDMCKAICPLS